MSVSQSVSQAIQPTSEKKRQYLLYFAARHPSIRPPISPSLSLCVRGEKERRVFQRVFQRVIHSFIHSSLQMLRLTGQLPRRLTLQGDYSGLAETQTNKFRTKAFVDARAFEGASFSPRRSAVFTPFLTPKLP
mmetsp:Transcript_6381/g.12957  ORF Transcript_6381/g.12957 Transcript_6381/m.12957 type:complete len:133 (+) Transcript_6381:221-619(+)